jgi:glycosyltransferase involved in cell wall biosynthesis
MKIAHIVCTYPPYFGGMGNVVFETASHLAELGHEVEVFTPQYYQKKEIRTEEAEPAHMHTEELQEQIDYANRLETPLSYGNAAYMPQVSRELDDFDIVHLHYPFFGTANTVRRWKMRNPDKPLVITYHMDTRGPGWKGLAFKLYAKYWMPKILGVADKLIVSSFDYIEASDASVLFRANKNKWVELPFGVDIERFQPREPLLELFKRHNLIPDLPTVLFVGGMDAAHYFKGIDVLIRSLAILNNNDRHVQAVLVGDGELRSTYEQRVHAYGLKSVVKFAGKVDDDELPLYYNMGDLCVLPSTSRNEAFGMVLLESMASGVPVIASDLPGVRSVAKEGGLVFEPGNERELAQNISGYFSPDNNIMEWRENVRMIAEEKYSWREIVTKLERIYDELV